MKKQTTIQEALLIIMDVMRKGFLKLYLLCMKPANQNHMVPST